MEKYESKQRQIRRPAAAIYPLFSNFAMLTPALASHLDEWSATEDTCSFKLKGMTVKLRIVDKQENRYVKFTGDDGGVPIDFTFWIQLHEVSADDTRVRMVLHVELNMMMRMMLGGKIQDGLDRAVDGLADAFNRL